MIIINLHCSIWIIRLRCKWVTYCFFMHHTENIRKSSIKFLYCCQMIWVNFRFRLSFFFYIHNYLIQRQFDRDMFIWKCSCFTDTYIYQKYLLVNIFKNSMYIFTCWLQKKNFGRRHITSVVISTWFPASTWSYCLHIVSQLLTGQRPFSIIIT